MCSREGDTTSFHCAIIMTKIKYKLELWTLKMKVVKLHLSFIVWVAFCRTFPGRRLTEWNAELLSCYAKTTHTCSLCQQPGPREKNCEKMIIMLLWQTWTILRMKPQTTSGMLQICGDQVFLNCWLCPIKPTVGWVCQHTKFEWNSVSALRLCFI